VQRLELLEHSEVDAAARVLAAAFRDNPGILSVLPGLSEATRLRLLTPCMVGFTKSLLRYGVVEVVRDNAEIVGVSLSFRPGEYPAPFFATVMQAPGPLRAGLRTALRFIRVDHEMRKRHPHYRHWYLWLLGVLPERQGQGVGSALLKALSARAEADRVPCYLETDKASSVKIYERHGYRVEAEDVLPKIDLKLWYMKRATLSEAASDHAR
jgi:ribosomal protein S18 acetylase RimI-like enzyme